MCDVNIQAEIYNCLRRIETELSSQDYESGGIFSVGGATGNYVIRSPFNTECEWQIYGITATAAAQVSISSTNSGIATLSATGAQSIGLTSNGMETNATDGIILTMGASTTTYTPLDVWQPLGRGANVYIAMTIANSNSCFVAIAFRRAIAKYIPILQKPKPHTHTPLSARHIRTSQWNAANYAATVGNMQNFKPVEDTGYLSASNTLTTSSTHPTPNPMGPLDARAKKGTKNAG